MRQSGMSIFAFSLAMSLVAGSGFSQSLEDNCRGGDASSCMKYSTVLSQACTQVPQKTPVETLQCNLDVQCYQDKALGLQQYGATCSGASASTLPCTLTKQRIDASCPKRNPNGVGTYMPPSELQALQQAILGPGHSVLINWYQISANSGGLANPVAYPNVGFLGGGDDDAANVAHDNIVNRPEHVCLIGLPDSGKVVVVPGKWISNRCNAVWNNTYTEAPDFSAAIRYPNGAHGHWGLLGEQPASNQLFVHPLPSLDPNIHVDLNTSLSPCMAHYGWQKTGVDRAISAITQDSLVVDTGDQLGYIVGQSCRFEFAGGQATSSDNVRVYYLTYRPPPPVPVKLPSAPPPGAQNPQGTQWTVINHRSAVLHVFAFQHNTIAGYSIDCRNERPVRDMAQNDVWSVWVPSGSTLDVRFYEDDQGNGGCSANFVANPALDGRPGQATAREDVN